MESPADDAVPQTVRASPRAALNIEPPSATDRPSRQRSLRDRIAIALIVLLAGLLANIPAVWLVVRLNAARGARDVIVRARTESKVVSDWLAPPPTPQGLAWPAQAESTAAIRMYSTMRERHQQAFNMNALGRPRERFVMVVREAGWPFVSISKVYALTSDSFQGKSTRQNFYLASDGQWHATEPSFSWRPRVMGILGNSVVNAIVLVVVWHTLRLSLWRVLARIRAKRLERNDCPKCRYSRKGLPVDAPCPECGTHFHAVRMGA